MIHSFFCQLHSVINGEQREKYLYKQSNHFEKYGMFDCKSPWPFIDLKVGVLLDHGILPWSVLLLAFRTCWTTSQAKNNVKSAPALTAWRETLTGENLANYVKCWCW